MSKNHVKKKDINRIFRTSKLIIIIGVTLVLLVGIAAALIGASLQKITLLTGSFMIYLVIIMIFGIIPAFSGISAGCILGIRGGLIGGIFIAIFIFIMNFLIGIHLIVGVLVAGCTFGISLLCGVLTEKKWTSRLKNYEDLERVDLSKINPEVQKILLKWKNSTKKNITFPANIPSS